MSELKVEGDIAEGRAQREEEQNAKRKSKARGQRVAEYIVEGTRWRRGDKLGKDGRLLIWRNRVRRVASRHGIRCNRWIAGCPQRSHKESCIEAEPV